MSEVTGKIIHIGETLTVGSAGTFKKRLVVIQTDEQFSQQIPVDFVQDKTSILDQYKIGDDVVVGINIRGNEYNGKWYCSLNGWKISKQNTSQQSPDPRSESAVNAYETQSNPQEYPQAPANSPFGLNNNNLPYNTAGINEEPADDLPF